MDDRKWVRFLQCPVNVCGRLPDDGADSPLSAIIYGEFQLKRCIAWRGRINRGNLPAEIFLGIRRHLLAPFPSRLRSLNPVRSLITGQMSGPDKAPFRQQESTIRKRRLINLTETDDNQILRMSTELTEFGLQNANAQTRKISTSIYSAIFRLSGASPWRLPHRETNGPPRDRLGARRSPARIIHVCHT